jgi:hypothetical protein
MDELAYEGQTTTAVRAGLTAPGHVTTGDGATLHLAVDVTIGDAGAVTDDHGGLRCGAMRGPLPGF